MSCPPLPLFLPLSPPLVRTKTVTFLPLLLSHPIITYLATWIAFLCTLEPSLRLPPTPSRLRHSNRHCSGNSLTRPLCRLIETSEGAAPMIQKFIASYPLNSKPLLLTTSIFLLYTLSVTIPLNT